MNDILCLLNKKCRTEKSKEIVDNLLKEQSTVENIYSSESNKDK